MKLTRRQALAAFAAAPALAQSNSLVEPGPDPLLLAADHDRQLQVFAIQVQAGRLQRGGLFLHSRTHARRPMAKN